MDLKSFYFSAMGSPCEVHAYASSASLAGQVAREVEEEVKRLERRYSRYRADSVVTAINSVASVGGELTVDEETAGLLDYAFACHRKSSGLFDITSGLFRQVWNFSGASIPYPHDIDRLLPFVGMDKLLWDPPLLGFEVSGMEIDLGGIVKEYAADCAKEICSDFDIGHALIDLGGDIRVVGPHPGGSPWRIGIRNPRDPDVALKTIDLTKGALASSGDYERFLEVDGKRYCHLINPQTGWPVQGLAGVSVVAESCLVAGSIASIAMLKQFDGIDWLAGLGVDCLWMDAGMHVGGTLWHGA